MTAVFQSDTVYKIFRSRLSVQDIKDWHISDEMQIHAEELLNKNNAGTLTSAEQAELEIYREMDSLLTMMKLKAEIEAREASS